MDFQRMTDVRKGRIEADKGGHKAAVCVNVAGSANLTIQSRCQRGESLLTLKDAAKYVVALPAKTSAREPWQFAMQTLIDAADRGGIYMLARIVMLRAL